MNLDAGALSTFAASGALVLRGLVPSPTVVKARAAIDEWYANGMDVTRMTAYTQRTFAPELGTHPDVLELFSGSPLPGIVQQLVGEYAAIERAQIQIRVPDAALDEPQPEKSMHVDGVACPHLDPDELRTFSLLVGVVLSEIATPDGGALHFVREGHLAMADWFRTEWALGVTEQVPHTLDAVDGTPFLGSPGDVVLLHHLVPHAVGRNQTNVPRVMAYFRVSHVLHPTRRLEALRDPWTDFEPVRRHLMR